MMTKWQSLTDEEIETIDEQVDAKLLAYNFCIDDYVHEFAYAIEHALKEKNYADND
jgi:hypothetical protein